jgi:hypothetical protein
MSSFQTFLQWEEKSRDTIDFKKAYVDMAGDLVAGLMLSQIVYWYLPSRAGDAKLRVERDDHQWLVKTREDWWEECRLSPREVDRARKVLETAGLIEVKLFKFNGSPTLHIRILEHAFLESWEAAVQGRIARAKRKFRRGSNSGEDPSAASAQTRKSISLISEFQNGEMDFPDQGNPFHQSVRTLTENTAETFAENTADSRACRAKPKLSDLDPAAAELVVQMTEAGVNRTDAIRLAQESPDECRRQLEFLLYVAEFRSGRGAYLRAAIEQGFGPPKGWEEAQKRAAKKRREKTDVTQAEETQRQEQAKQRALEALKAELRRDAPLWAQIQQEAESQLPPPLRGKPEHVAYKPALEANINRIVAARGGPGRAESAPVVAHNLTS